MTVLTIEPYTQHDWGNLTWALLLTALGVVVVIDMAMFLVVAHRAKAVPGQRRHRHT